ncbi:polyprenyl synthetase family protein [Thermanaeromonas sp. C210]|uniref:polyprenyl synthetase family protein n=1 Tax=Thermanaeromonas sp. C210 TaxID=2731925 RepID=UPI00155D47D8|nr:polyprenyl synthetase family protein [Thermanaeromonas sp. C210]GFN23572.1 heptaprenyl diphosphate synthase subunit II [Thermanaeromonas sp. C210]
MLNLSAIAEIQEELQALEDELLRQSEAPDPLLTQVTRQMVQAGGKRLRPVFVLLSGKCCGGRLKDLLPLAVAMEMIHMATLIHDDVIDASPLRRGRPTVWARWGERVSLHAGDYLFARALRLVANYDDPRIPSLLAQVSVKMVRGELEQLENVFIVDITVRDYLRRIRRKTALLISASCELGALVAGGCNDSILALRRYGRYLGMAFQLTDDVLDIVADPQILGKPRGSDLRQGVITLPAIYALRASPHHRRLALLLAKPAKGDAEIAEVVELIKGCGGTAYTLNVAESYLQKARKQLLLLPPGRPRDILEELTYFVKARGF